MFIVKCYLIAFGVLALVAVMAIGVCDDFPWKWLNILCKTILIIATLFVIVSLLALLV